MAILKENDLIEEIRKAEITNDFKLNKKQFETAKDLYYDAMFETNNSNKSIQEQKILIENIINDIRSNPNSSKIDISKLYLDVKGFSYYDTFLEYGESNRIIKALKENKIPTDVLKGLAKGQDFNNGNGVETTAGNVQIIQMTESDDDSPMVVYFEILLNGISIYKYPENAKTNYLEEEETFFERAERIYEESAEGFSKGQTITHRNIRKHIEGKSIAIKEEIYESNTGELKTRKRYAAGTIINGIKVGGRFVKD